MTGKINSIQYVGHASVFLHRDNYTIAIDPWLEGNPSCPASCKKPAKLDLILLTHGHFDHACEASILAKQYGSKIVAIYELGGIMESEGVPEAHVVKMNKGGTVSIDGLSITLTHAMHSNGYDTPNGTLYAGEPCGIVVRDGTRSIYHAGDTALFSDMALIKDSYAPQIAILPIGDRFTMGPKEAATAAKLIGAKTAIPVHHSTFPLLTGTPMEFSEHCSALGIKTVPLAPGEKWEIV